MFGSAASSYVRDVPVRLNKKFYPLPRLNGSFDAVIDSPVRRPTDVLFEKYDFDVEKKALQDFQQNILQSTASNYSSNGYNNKLLPDADSVVAETNGLSSSSSGIECPAAHSILSKNNTVNGIIRSAVAAPPPPPQLNGSSTTTTTTTTNINGNMFTSSSSAAPLRALLADGGGILQPTVVNESVVKLSNVERQQQQQQQASTTRSVLRLEDFESVECSPFDMVELKSINDIEELQRLWSQQQPQPQQQSKEYVS